MIVLGLQRATRPTEYWDSIEFRLFVPGFIHESPGTLVLIAVAVHLATATYKGFLDNGKLRLTYLTSVSAIMNDGSAILQFLEG